MATYVFFLKEKYCQATTNPYTAIRSCLPNEETKQWFKDQQITLIPGYQAEFGVLCTAMNITEDQALLIQLAYDVQSDAQQFYQ